MVKLKTVVMMLKMSRKIIDCNILCNLIKIFLKNLREVVSNLNLVANETC